MKHLPDNAGKGICSMDKNKPRIKIIKNGPDLVSGNVPLYEKIITPKGKGYEWKPGRSLRQAERYALCRCGKSKNPPFCDGSHEKCNFHRPETASDAPYAQRADIIEGPDLDLMDDGRCAYARFCHREDGNVWELTRASDDPHLKEEAIKAAGDCPTGRLVAILKNGEAQEPDFEPAIEILQDPEEGVSAGIFVKGGIPIESADGHVYEIRNRAALCRCGQSRNMPFCDATHVAVGYDDHEPGEY